MRGSNQPHGVYISVLRNTLLVPPGCSNKKGLQIQKPLGLSHVLRTLALLIRM